MNEEKSSVDVAADDNSRTAAEHTIDHVKASTYLEHRENLRQDRRSPKKDPHRAFVLRGFAGLNERFIS